MLRSKDRNLHNSLASQAQHRSLFDLYRFALKNNTREMITGGVRPRVSKTLDRKCYLHRQS